MLWDVGHQAYPHKILTGRREGLPTIRQYDGLAPFCSVFESEHDIMGAGHASTSIGYGVGLKEAMRKGIGEDGKVAAVIGDGALTGGVAYEALHAAGGLQTPMVIVLNDNGMSISPNVGALSRYFNRVRLNPRLYHAREGVEDRLTKLPLGLGKRIERLGPEIKSAIKAYWAPGLFFEELDLAYMGVIDGHDVHALREALREAFEADRPVVVHIHTVKGKGFAPAEEGGLEGMEKWHAAKPNSIVNGRARAARPVGRCRSPTRRRRSRRSGWRSRRRPARRRSTRRSSPTRSSPRRGATSAWSGSPRRWRGGPACRSSPTRCPSSTTTSASPSRTRCCWPRGWRSRARSRSARSTRPSSSAPSTRSSTTSACRSSTSPSRWTGRAWSATTARPTTAPSTSPTSARSPTSSLMAPRDEAMLVHMLRTAIAHDGPAALRYPRGAAEGVELPAEPAEIPIGSGELLASGERVALLGYGYGVSVALDAAKILAGHDLSATVADARFAKPLDSELLERLALGHDLVVTIEENVLPGGFGSAVLEHLEDAFAERSGERARVLRDRPARPLRHPRQAGAPARGGRPHRRGGGRAGPRRPALRRARAALNSAAGPNPPKLGLRQNTQSVSLRRLFWGYLREERHLYVCGSAGREPRGSTAFSRAGAKSAASRCRGAVTAAFARPGRGRLRALPGPPPGRRSQSRPG